MTIDTTIPTPFEQFLNTVDAAKILKLSPRTLERMRVEGGGPKFCKAGPGKRSRVLYRYQDLLDWLAPRSFDNTSQYGKAPGE